MPTPTVPTGSALISMSNNIRAAFAGQRGWALGNYRGSHPSLPAQGQTINFSSFRGLTAPTPSLTLTVVAGTSSLSADATGTITGKVSSNQVGALSYSLAAFVTNSTYGGGSHTYAVTAGALPSGFSLDPSTGILAIAGVTAPTAGSATVTITNAYGNSFSQVLTFGITSAAAMPVPATGQNSNTFAMANGLGSWVRMSYAYYADAVHLGTLPSLSTDNTKVVLNVARTGTTGPSTYATFYGSGNSVSGPGRYSSNDGVNPIVVLQQPSTINFNTANNGWTMALYFIHPSTVTASFPTLCEIASSARIPTGTQAGQSVFPAMTVILTPSAGRISVGTQGLYSPNNMVALDRWTSVVISYVLSTGACTMYFNNSAVGVPSYMNPPGSNVTTCGIIPVNFAIGCGQDTVNSKPLTISGITGDWYAPMSEAFQGSIASASMLDYAVNATQAAAIYNYHLSL